MSTLTTKYKTNTDGPFYVTSQCIACDTCLGIAPFSFTLTTDGEHAYVHTQPSNGHEHQLCDQALFSCPVSAIQKELP